MRNEGSPASEGETRAAWTWNIRWLLPSSCYLSDSIWIRSGSRTLGLTSEEVPGEREACGRPCWREALTEKGRLRHRLAHTSLHPATALSQTPCNHRPHWRPHCAPKPTVTAESPLPGGGRPGLPGGSQHNCGGRRGWHHGEAWPQPLAPGRGDGGETGA